MAQDEEKFKTLLRDYHAALMKIRDTYLKVPNSERGQKNQGAQEAGITFAAKVSDFESEYGSLLR